MSTPSSAGKAPHQHSSDSASLTERRRAETRMEIARAAAGLFVSRGLKATRAEDIARAAGCAPRTFYRYFATKEEAVAPLYAAGARRWAEAVREAPAALSVPEALEHAARHTLTPGPVVPAASWEWIRALIRLAATSPALRKVWAQVCQESEQALAEILAARVAPAGSDNVAATAASAAPASSAASMSASSASASSASADFRFAASASADFRFAAAVASAAVRVAVESWAATANPPSGPEGPAALTLRNLAALRGFPWEATP